VEKAVECQEHLGEAILSTQQAAAPPDSNPSEGPTDGPNGKSHDREGSFE